MISQLDVTSANPFRLLGIFANGTEAEVLVNRSQLRVGQGQGVPGTLAVDFACLKWLVRTEEKMDGALTMIERPHDRLLHSLMWFVDYSPTDKIAFEHLRNSEFERVFEIWRGEVDGKEVSPDNFSSFLNLSTLLMSQSIIQPWIFQFPSPGEGVDEEWLRESFQLKGRLIRSDALASLAEIVGAFLDAGRPLSASDFAGRMTHDFAEIVYSSIKPFLNIKYTGSDLFTSIGEMSEEMAAHLRTSLTERPRREIETAVAKAMKRVDASKADAVQAGFDLYYAALEPLKELQIALVEVDVIADTARNLIVNQLIDCAMAGHHAFSERERAVPPDSVLHLIELVKSLSPMGQTAKRLDEVSARLWALR